MKMLYETDDIKLNAERITEYNDPVYGDITVFHDVVIASEMVQLYEDGKALKTRDELELYTWTVDGRWVTIGGHPEEGVISERDQVSGRTVNPRYVINLIDPNTERPCRAGVRADVEIFNDRVPKPTLDDMKNGKKQDVSIGFFYGRDDTPGTVEDGPFKGADYDYVQRNMFHDHTAAALESGRCPSPYCGLTADEIKKQVTGDPFAGFPDWDACIAHMTKPKKEGGQGYTEAQAERVCGMLKAEHEEDIVEEDDLVKYASKILTSIMEVSDEIEALKGERDALKEKQVTPWWKQIDWKAEDNPTLFDALNEETRQLITEAGVCPTCGDKSPRTEAERAMSHFDLTEEEWAELSDEEKQEHIDKLPEKGSGGDMSLEDINSEIARLQEERKVLRDKLDTIYEEKSPTEEVWNQISKIDEEIQVYLQAKAIKVAADEMTDIDGYELDYVEEDAQWDYAYKKALPDSAYAYIEAGCEKEDGKTQQSCRHMPIKDKGDNYDAAHVRAALSALAGGRTGKVPPYASKAKGKVCAGAKALEIESEICGTKKKKKEDTLDPYKVLKRSREVMQHG